MIRYSVFDVCSSTNWWMTVHRIGMLFSHPLAGEQTTT